MESASKSSLPTRPVAVPAYVLITPARNEAAFIELTLQSVVSQTIKPLKWVIVSDGSTDGTDEIISRYAAQHCWIELVRMPERRERHFAGKVHAFNAGLARVTHLEYEFIASLDADITFDREYFSYLLDKFAGNPKLGLVGTPFREGNESYDYRYVSIEHVSGACQLFRRTCFSEIGGYTAVKGGGIDHIAVLSARFKGWQTRSYTEKVSEHHRAQGSAKRGPLKAKWHVGTLDYSLGGHPLWEAFRALYQLTKKPYFLGGILILGGYSWAAVTRRKKSISRELVDFRRREQMTRLRAFLVRRPSLPADSARSCEAL